MPFARIDLLIRNALFPTLLLCIPTLYFAAKAFDWSLSATFASMAIGRFVFLMLLERWFPARREWSINWPSFRRDLKYIALNGATYATLKMGISVAAIDTARFNAGLLGAGPIWLEVLVLVLVFEFFQYWLHRLSHSGRGMIGEFLWRIHVAHHLPRGVYLLMHGNAHPINVLLIAIVQLPLVLLGASSDAMFFFAALTALQGLVSHLNVDSRADVLNYVLVGSELHRYHHSARLNEAKNFGAVTPFWDLVFGTFVYKPGFLPVRLGVSEPDKYPRPEEVARVIALPFRWKESTKSPSAIERGPTDPG